MNELRMATFPGIKARVLKKYKKAKIVAKANGKFVVEDGFGRSIIANYPELAVCDNVYDAWKNAMVADHWNYIGKRNTKKFRNDVAKIEIQEFL